MFIVVWSCYILGELVTQQQITNTIYFSVVCTLSRAIKGVIDCLPMVPTEGRI